MAQDPLYRQIAEDLERQIASGAYPPGSKLPSEMTLVKSHGASRNTVREAIRWLATSGKVVSKPGPGTFVVKRPAPFTTVLTAGTKTPGSAGVETPGGEDDRDQKTIPDKQALDVRPLVANPDVADRLGIPPGSAVIRRRETRTIDDVAWSQEASYYPFSFVENGAFLLISPLTIDGGTVAYLTRKNFTCVRSDTATCSGYELPMLTRPGSLTCPRTGGPPCSRYSRPDTTSTANPCG